jgi:ABC-type glycerol-3-phosphate transport system substrate-binding protein
VIRRAAVLLVALLALAGCSSDEDAAPESGTPTVTPAAGVKELANVLELRSDFEADAGKTRVILLFSPT